MIQWKRCWRFSATRE